MKNKYLLLLALLAGAFSGAFADVTGDDVVGQPVTFEVSHNGTGTFSYQWKKDGADIAGATAQSFRIAAIKAADAGVYTCQVTNKAGTILSDRGIFSVTVNPTTATITIKRL